MQKFYPKILVVVLLLTCAATMRAQNVNVNPGGGSYPTLQAAFAAINAGTHTGAVTVDIVANTTETGSAVLNASGSGAASYTGITIQPVGIRTVTGALALPLIDFNGANNVLLNGLNDGVNSLAISNTSTSGTGGTSTIRFINDASNNTVTNCSILGSSTGVPAQNGAASSPAAATILFAGSTGSSGNDNNTLSNNTIAEAATNLPVIAISSAGQSTSISNDNITISGNNIANFYGASGANGIAVGSNSSAFTISNNKFYEDASRSGLATASYWEAIFISTAPGGGYTISGNTIGYASASGTGMLTNSGGRFIGIDVFAVASSPASSIQGNIINGISWTTASGAATFGACPFSAIQVKAGLVNIGTTTGNTIGATSGTGGPSSNIYVVSTSNGTLIEGIYVSSANDCNIRNNTTGGIATGGTAAIGYNFIGIVIAGTGNHNVTLNNIGNTTSGGVALGTLGTTTAACGLYGIYSTGSGNIVIGSSGAANNIRNLVDNSSGANTLMGIYSNGAISGTGNINYNTFTNIVHAAASTGTGGGLIYLGGASSSGTINIGNNTFNADAFSFTGTTGGTGTLYGIFNNSTWANANVSNNDFNNMSVKSSGAIGLIFFGGSNATPNFNITGNTITTGFARTVASSNAFYGILSQGGATSGTQTISGNILSNINIAATSTSIYGINSLSGNTIGSGPNCIISGNTISNMNANTGAGNNIALYVGYGNTNSISNNTISNITSSGGNVFGIYQTTNTLTGNINSNTISALTGSGSVSSTFAIYSSPSAGSTINIYQNTIDNINASIAGTAYSTIYYSANGIYCATTKITAYSIYQNVISNITANGVASQATAINMVAGATTSNVYRNKIYNVTGNTTSGFSYGMNLANSTTANIYNNYIGDIKTPASGSNYYTVYGISLGSTFTTCNLYYNTVYLTGTSSATGFSSIAVSASTTPTVRFNNNIFTNLCAPTGTGIAVAYQRTSTTLTTYSASSDNNLFYAGTPGTANVIFTDQTNTDQTLATYKTRVSARDAASISVVPVVASTSGSAATYLHLTTDANCAIDGKGAPVAGYTNDYDNDTRDASTPDIGADEFTGNFNLTITNPAAACSSVDITAAAVTAGSSSGTTLSYWEDAAATIAIQAIHGTASAITTSGTYYIKSVKGSCSSVKPVSVTVTTAATNVVLATAGTNGSNMATGCTEGGWTYYTDPSDATKYLFAINWDPGSIGENTAAKAAATAKLQVDAGVYGQDDGALQGTWVMRRYWNVDLHGATMTAPVNLRFFYDPAEKTATDNAATSFQSAHPGSLLETPQWFKTVGTDYANDASHVNYQKVQSAIVLTDVSGGATLNGVTYAQFNGITSFSGGSYASGVGVNGVLPIGIAYFRGSRQGSAHNLTWKVNCGVSPRITMTLERSSDGRSWAGINSLTADAARCFDAFNYTDASPLAGINYYRLKTVDVDGKVTYSTIVTLLNAAKGIQIVNIAPNPVVNGRFRLNVTSAELSTMDIVITDMAGRVVLKKTASIVNGFNGIDMDVSHLASGTYQLTGSTTAGRTTLSFVKQ